MMLKMGLSNELCNKGQEPCSEAIPERSYTVQFTVPKIHMQIANARRDFLHKATTTTTTSQNHAMVFVEDLQVRNMSKSAAGTVEN